MEKEIKWTPAWKKVCIKFDSAAEQIFGKKSVIELPDSMNEKKSGFQSATVVSFCPLAGTDSRTGQRYWVPKVGQKVLANRGQCQIVNYKGQTYTYIQDVFIVATEIENEEFDQLANQELDKFQLPESELPSTIGELDDISCDHMKME